MPLISEFPNLVLVCPSNCGSGTLTEITAVSPSLTSSPLKRTSALALTCLTNWFRTLTKDVLNPAK